jgi:sugar phosphate isomerase/epimerase
MSWGEGFRELIKVTRLIGEMAGSYGIGLAVEPLNAEETNCVTTLREGALLEAAVNSPAVGLLADLYHILKQGEPVEDILSLRELRHTHIALLEGRAFPTAPHPSVEAFFRALGEISYGGTMSIEGRAEDLGRDAVTALKVLRSYAA